MATALVTDDSTIRTARKSFMDILSGSSSRCDVHIRKATTYCNIPVFKDIHPSLLKLGLRGSFTVGALKPGYVLINLSLEEDFARMWVRQEWFVAGRSMRLFRWTPAFTYAKESAIAPAWISLPDLPIHLFAKGALYSVASLIGNPIKIDESTANRTRPSIARVCVEIDLLQPPIPQVVIKSGQNIFHQKVFYEDRPAFCNICFHRGHTAATCFSNGASKPTNNTHKPVITTTDTNQQVPNKPALKVIETNPQAPNLPDNRNRNLHTKNHISNLFKDLDTLNKKTISSNPETQPKNKEYRTKGNVNNPKSHNQIPESHDPEHQIPENTTTTISSPTLQVLTSPPLLRKENFISTFEEGECSSMAEESSEQPQESQSHVRIAANSFAALQDLALHSNGRELPTSPLMSEGQSPDPEATNGQPSTNLKAHTESPGKINCTTALIPAQYVFNSLLDQIKSPTLVPFQDQQIEHFLSSQTQTEPNPNFISLIQPETSSCPSAPLQVLTISQNTPMASTSNPPTNQLQASHTAQKDTEKCSTIRKPICRCLDLANGPSPVLFSCIKPSACSREEELGSWARRR